MTKEEWEQALIERHGMTLQKKLADATVAICGLGGLGSNIAIILARAGIGKLIIVDFDRVDITNLHRQQYKVNQLGMYKTEALYQNLREIAPFMDIEMYTQKLCKKNTEKLLVNADIICEAFDVADEKSMLADIVLERMQDKYLISASGMAGIDTANSIKTKKITKKFYVCGDGISDVNGGIGLISSRVTICAAHQAHMVIRILNNDFDV